MRPANFQEKVTLLLAGVFLAGSLSSPGIVRRHDKPGASYKSLGNQSQFASVGLVEARYSGTSSYTPLGSATLIASNWILSAAHVFDSEALEDVTGLRFVLGGQNYNINISGTSAIHLHPNWDPGSEDLHDDVAVIKLSSSSSVQPASLYAGSVPLGSTVILVGYGMIGTGTNGSVQDNREKYAAENALDYFISENQFEVDFDRPSNASYSTYGSKTPLTLEGLLGPGDSGGSTWYQSPAGWGIVGINSYGYNAMDFRHEDGYGDISGFTYVPKFIDWITSFGAFSVIPEPSAALLLGLGAMFFLRRRERR